MARGLKTSFIVAVLAAVFAAVLGTSPAFAAKQTFDFHNLEQEQRYQKLVKELRCTVCQSESIYESNAAFAADVRTKVYEMVQDEKTDDDIVNFMVERYGDYISFRPALQKNTWVLWFAPLLMLLLGVGIWRSVVANRRLQAETGLGLSSEDKAELARRLK